MSARRKLATGAGYCPCACRDCFDTAISADGYDDALCHACQDAGCEAHAERECCAPGAYGCDDESAEVSP